MNGRALLGIVLILYAGLVIWIAIKKPPKIWEMSKIKTFIRVLGEKGTVIFFYVWATIALVAGIYCLVS